jgi:hypothetical protein
MVLHWYTSRSQCESSHRPQNTVTRRYAMPYSVLSFLFRGPIQLHEVSNRKSSRRHKQRCMEVKNSTGMDEPGSRGSPLMHVSNPANAWKAHPAAFYNSRWLAPSELETTSREVTSTKRRTGGSR